MLLPIHLQANSPCQQIVYTFEIDDIPESEYERESLCGCQKNLKRSWSE